MKIYFYKLTVDDGGAPCVQDEMLSLAICKPRIRSTARSGDLLFGFAANSLRRGNALIYVACLTDRLTRGKYYEGREFEERRDCIYERVGERFVRRRAALFHERAGDLGHDLGSYPEYGTANVLVSRDFRYFGSSANADYKAEFPLIAPALKCLGQGHRVWHEPALHDELLRLKEYLWQQRRVVVGEPISPPRPNAPHGGGGCGELC